MESTEFGPHISRRFDQELETLRNKVLRMGGLVQDQLQKSIHAVVTGDSELGLKVSKDDHKVNMMEVEIDEDCSHILVRRAPAAMDLRLILMVVKTITDLERIGDEAGKIGYLASRLAAMEQPDDHYRELKNLASHVLAMLEDTLDAFTALDIEKAKAVVKEDERVDQEYEAITRHCLTLMTQDPTAIKRVMNVTWAARALERIGDHAKNISEYVVFLVLGKDVRHTELSELLKEN
ncbi:MAG: phosphate signaling complex protein PhoU [Gammaproteobacteria bacterium]